MPLNSKRLQKTIMKEMERGLKKDFGNKPGSKMKPFAKGIAEGFVKTALGKKGKIKPPSGLGGVGMGISGVVAEQLSQAMIREVNKAFGSEGVALKTMTLAISKALIKELAKASVTGTNGGTAKGFKLGSPATMGKAMFKATGFKKTKENGKLFKALAKAIIDQVKKSGKSKIPRTGPGSGPGIAVIS